MGLSILCRVKFKYNIVISLSRVGTKDKLNEGKLRSTLWRDKGQLPINKPEKFDHDGPIKILLHLEISNHFELEQGTDNRFRPHPQGSGQGMDELIIIVTGGEMSKRGLQEKTMLSLSQNSHRKIPGHHQCG